MPAEATHRSDTFRRAQLYTVPVHDVWLKHEASLRAVYEYYSAGDDDLAITQAGQTTGPSLYIPTPIPTPTPTPTPNPEQARPWG